MNSKLTVNRSFHVQTRRNGSKSLAEGKAPTKPQGRVPRITRLLALAHRCRDLVRDGVIINQSELAHYGQISTTRMSQIMWLDNLAPEIQEQILDLPRTIRGHERSGATNDPGPRTIQGRDAILEREVRPIAKTLDWDDQRKMWADLLHRSQASSPTKQI
ncbi:hypothetical protein [Novipirellula artificiosorum]|uniref:Uncharacterized protein n=1 Tax=Novipirellula artificiosorum TaxID=2528016 RepID=A0A5C6CWU7_9BACT|nr:hypothetical protein [Novipirellula artificiosorum]TWU28037.1 hypothetical protein Poly41_69330 [Novipirellula artificiosorum]